VWGYSKEAMDHFSNPRNVGALKEPDRVGTGGKVGQGPYVQIYVKVRDGRIDEISFQTYGCPAAIASASKLTDMVKGKTVEEALGTAPEALIEAIGGLPLGKHHCARIAVGALRDALAGPPGTTEGSDG